MKIIEAEKDAVATLADLKTGTLLKGLANNPEKIYIKVSEIILSETQVIYRADKSYCVLLDLSTGILGIVPRNLKVTVLDGTLHIEKVNKLEDYLR